MIAENSCSIALSFSFRPSLDDHEKIHLFLAKIFKKAARRVLPYAVPADAEMLLARLNECIKKLDFNTQRKGVIILVFLHHEKMIYLKDEVNTRVLFGENLCLLQLLTALKKELSFYLVVYGLSRLTAYEFKNNFLRQVNDKIFQANISLPEANRMTFSMVEKLYRVEEKPIFLLGRKGLAKQAVKNLEPNMPIYSLQQFSGLSTSAYLLKICAALQRNQVNVLSKYQLFRISTPDHPNKLFAGLLHVFNALRQNRDGVLFIDTSFVEGFVNLTVSKEDLNFKPQFLSSIERFLQRGNRIEVTKPDLLLSFGGVALLDITRTAEQVRSYVISIRRGNILF
jgi:hypothetical protein